MRESVPTYRLYGEESETSSDFWIHCETLPVRTHLHNWEIAPHRHDAFFQMFRIDSGRGMVIGPGPRLDFAAPCILFIPPGAVHGFSYSRDVDGIVVTAVADRLHAVSAGDPAMAAFAATTRVVPIAPASRDATFASTCIDQIHHELSARRVARLMMLEPLTVATLVSLARASGATSASREHHSPRDRGRIEQLLSLIALHVREHRPVSFFAERIGLSPTQLNRLARAQTGQSVQQLIAARLVETAKRELVFTPSSIQAIAYSLGFSDPAYFNRFFRRATGSTPGAYRLSERDKLEATA